MMTHWLKYEMLEVGFLVIPMSCMGHMRLNTMDKMLTFLGIHVPIMFVKAKNRIRRSKSVFFQVDFSLGERANK